MRRAERKAQEKGTGGVVGDEAFRASEETLLEFAVNDAFLRELDAGSIAGVKRERQHVVAVGKPEEQVETMSGWRPSGRKVPEVPLTDQRRGIIGLQRLGNRDFGQRQAAPIVGQDDLVSQAGADRVASGKQPGARRRADVGGGIEVAECDSLRRHPVQKRCLDPACAIDSDIAVAKVIGQNDDEVGWSARRACPAERRLRKHREGRTSQSR